VVLVLEVTCVSFSYLSRFDWIVEDEEGAVGLSLRDAIPLLLSCLYIPMLIQLYAILSPQS